jgi:hypothetical protein
MNEPSHKEGVNKRHRKPVYIHIDVLNFIPFDSIIPHPCLPAGRLSLSPAGLYRNGREAQAASFGSFRIAGF